MMDSEEKRPVPSIESKVDGERKKNNNHMKRLRYRREFSDKRKSKRNTVKNQSARCIDYNHGRGRQQPYGYDPPMHDMPQGPPNTNFYGPYNYDDFRRPLAPDMYPGPPRNEADMYPGPPRNEPDMYPGPPCNESMYPGPPRIEPDIYPGPPRNDPDMYPRPPHNEPDMYPGPPRNEPDMYSGPPRNEPDMYPGPPHNEPDMYRGPPRNEPDMYHGPPRNEPDMYPGPPRNDMFDDRHNLDMNRRCSGYDMHDGPPMHHMHSGPPMHTLHNGPPIPEMCNGPPISNMPNGPPMHNMHNGPPMPDMPNGPPVHDMHNRPPMHSMPNGPPGRDMHNGPPMHNMTNGPPMCNGPPMHGGQPIHDMHNGPPVRTIPNGPPMHDMHNGPVHNMPNGPSMHDLHNKPPMHEMHSGPMFHRSREMDNCHGPLPPIFNGPPNSDQFHGPSNSEFPSQHDRYDRSQGPNGYHRPPNVNVHGPHGSNSHFGSNGPDNRYPPQGPQVEHGRESFHRPGLPNGPQEMECVPHGLDNFHGPPGPVLNNGQLEKDRYNVQGMSDSHPPPHLHHRPVGPENHSGPPGVDVQHSPHILNSDRHRDHIKNSKPPHLDNSSSKVPDICLNPLPHEYAVSHPHHSPIYPLIPLGVAPLSFVHTSQVPPPSIPISNPSIDQTIPPLPQTPPTVHQPPLPPSPHPPPRPPSPRPPSPTSPPPQSPGKEVYDPVEALFSSGSSSESPEMSEKQKESNINKYVKCAQKLKTSAKFVQPVEHSPSNKQQMKKPKPKTVEEISEVPITEESPARPSLDARLKLMFGASSEKESPKKEKKKSPPKLSHELKRDLREFARPLSPPPSPFRSKQMYHYWHKVTLKMRRSSKVSSVDFVNANTVSGSQNKLDKSGLSENCTTQAKFPHRSAFPHPKSHPYVTPNPSVVQDGKKSLANTMDCTVDSSVKNDKTLSNRSISARDHVIENALDSEFELTCEGPSEVCERISESVRVNCVTLQSCDEKNITSDQQDKSPVESCEMTESVDLSDSKTINIVLSKVIEELKSVIRRELAGEILEKEIKKFMDIH